MHTTPQKMTDLMKKAFLIAMDASIGMPEAENAFRVFRREFLRCQFDSHQFGIFNYLSESDREELEYLREMKGSMLEAQQELHRFRSDLKFANVEIVAASQKASRATAELRKAKVELKKTKAELEKVKAANDDLGAENQRLKSELAVAEHSPKQRADEPAGVFHDHRGDQMVSWDDFVLACVRRLKNRFFGWQITFCAATGIASHRVQGWRRRGMVPAENMARIEEMAPVAPKILRTRWMHEELDRVHAMALAGVAAADIFDVMRREFPDSPRTLDAVRSAVTRFRRGRQLVTSASGRGPAQRPVLGAALA